MPEPLRIVLGVSSGIAAYKTPELVRLLRRRGVEVKVAVTPSAAALVGPDALRTVSGHPVYRDGAASEYDMDHIRLAEWGQWYVICPATANTLAKIAHGIADNLVTTLALSFERRLAVVPAMNSAMWTNAVTQRNVELLRQQGVRVLPVEDGELACGGRGPGRMLDIETVAGYVAALGQGALLAGRRVLIASGPTQEPLDPVRVITNRSSGRMGAALAAGAWAMGAQVTVVSGPSAVPPPSGVRRIDVTTAAEMQAALEKEFKSADVCIMAAAVSDYRPAKASAGKIKRGKGAGMTLALAPTADILEGLGRRKGRRFLVGFALETGRGMDEARRKLTAKHCDMLVLNYVDTSLGLATAQATILYTAGEPETLPAMDKTALAGRILTRVAERMGPADG